ncbi:hypothetical protein BDQ17DRAFT_1345822 [Cyathus striatus]|nr:hypothetical protein BDQ17DRAFT_1376994 [Cyathus striatus]KAF9011259.1 hypothetical protein BDQ17DRAFT_1345822 [Cyathus striatus]
MTKLLTATALAAYVGLAFSQSSPVSYFLLCEDVNLSGRCITFPYITNASQCINMPSYFNDLTSSVAPEGTGRSCTLYTDFACAGSNRSVTAYESFLVDFNDRTSSFRCTS